LALALKGCSEESAVSLLSNVSKRLAVMMLDDMESMGIVQKSVVLEAQELIINTINRLAASGEIILN
jgi:flagellar motor switch protein FliG